MKKVKWLENIENIDKGPVIFFGNEFLDALPIKQFKEIKGNLFEKYATLNNDKVNFIFKKQKKIKSVNFKILTY